MIPFSKDETVKGRFRGNVSKGLLERTKQYLPIVFFSETFSQPLWLLQNKEKENLH